MSDCAVVAETRDQVGECPVWSVAEQALYWVDIEGCLIRRLDWASRTQLSWRLPERVGCIALSAKGGLVAAMESGVFAVQLLAASEVRLESLATLQPPMDNMRFNDGRCDAMGRFWISTMCMDMSLAAPVGALYCLDESGLGHPRVEGLITPNGIAFSADGMTAYLSDSHPSVQKIWAFDFAAPAGEWSNRRLFADMTEMPGRPDGAAVDVNGCYWICGNDAGLVHCFSPQGELLRSLAVPVAKPSMCAFGGPNLNQLLVTSILPASESRAQPGLNGAVFALDAGVAGQAEPCFSRFPVSSI
jgi:sugar lactone lactonase YvrE